MGTRADFYVGRGLEAEWLGSIGWDGYPAGIGPEVLAGSTSEETWRSAVAALLDADESASTPADGWPWPWEDSRTTDWSYAWDDGVWCSCFGYRWVTPIESDDDDYPGENEKKEAIFPNMEERAAVTFGGRSGLIVLGQK